MDNSLEESINTLPLPETAPPESPSPGSFMLTEVSDLQYPPQTASSDMTCNNEINDAIAEEIAEYASNLESQRLSYENTGRYLEASAAKNKLEELRHQVAERKKQDVLHRQEAEVEALRNSQDKEWEELCGIWEQKERELRAKYLKELEELKVLHQQEINQLIEEIESAVINCRVRPSPSLLDLRRVEAALAKGGNYAEAAKVKADADQREVIELERTKMGVKSSGEAKLKKLKVLHKNQLSAFDRRFTTAKAEFQRKKSLDLEVCRKRFKNALQEISVTHGLEVVALNKAFGLRNAQNSGNEPESPRDSGRRTKTKHSLRKSPFLNSARSK
ncbi:hypothetical protein P9112_004262 [Eukaryota sp. TZLM1-RC]